MILNFICFEQDSHPLVLAINADFNIKNTFSSKFLLEDIITIFIRMTHKATDAANHSLLDSYMLDEDELQLGAFRFIRS